MQQTSDGEGNEAPKHRNLILMTYCRCPTRKNIRRPTTDADIDDLLQKSDEEDNVVVTANLNQAVNQN